jgi:hypothetical protein
MTATEGKCEVIFNLWYVFDQTGIIYFLLGRSYAGLNDDAESLALLRRHATTDHKIAQYFPVPARFRTTVVEGDSQREVAVIHTSSLGVIGGPDVLFQEAILQLQAQVHAMSGLSITEDPVVCITPLLLEVDGSLIAQTHCESA